MKYLSCTLFKSINFKILSVLIALLSFNSTVGAQRIFDFYIDNPASTEIKVKVFALGCYEAQMPNGQEYFIKPGERRKLGYIARVQGHGCDGKNGSFRLEFTPAQREGKDVTFVFDNGGSLWLAGANQYPGKLNPKSANSYTYTTYKNKILKAGKVTGSWLKVCQGSCGKVWSVVKNETSKSTSVSSEIKNAISVSLEAGMDFKLGSVKATVTGSMERTNSESMTQSVSNSTEEGSEIIFPTLEQMRSWNIFAVWQWVGTTRMSDGSVITIKTNMITCTPDGNSPNYVPGSKEDIGSCYGGRK